MTTRGVPGRDIVRQPGDDLVRPVAGEQFSAEAVAGAALGGASWPV